MSYFVKVVLVELANKASEVAVFEVFREDVFRELLILGHSQYVSLTARVRTHVPQGQQSYRLRYPNVLRSHLAGFPASCGHRHQYTATHPPSIRHILIELAYLQKVSKARSYQSIHISYKVARAVGGRAHLITVHCSRLPSRANLPETVPKCFAASPISKIAQARKVLSMHPERRALRLQWPSEEMQIAMSSAIGVFVTTHVSQA